MGRDTGLRRVLVVEDDPALGVLIAGTLSQAGYATTLAGTGDAALGLARKVPPDVVVSDVNLPGISGYEVCHTLRAELGDSVGFIFMSGCRIESLDRVAGLLLGADDYLVKPFEPDELVARVRAVLRRRRSNGEAASTSLTPREREILRLLADGLDQRSIASELRISSKTVGTHIEHILRKLDVHSRAQAVAAAYRDELLTASPIH